MTQTLVKLKRKYLIMIIVNTIPTQEVNKLTEDSFGVPLAPAKLTTKAGYADLVKKTDFDNKLETLDLLNLKIKFIKSKFKNFKKLFMEI